jgi:hypothetical protein
LTVHQNGASRGPGGKPAHHYFWRLIMGVMQEALVRVGFQPTKPLRPRDMRRAQEREDITLAFHNFLDGVLKPLISVRKVQVQQAGGFYRARYEGTKISCFGDTSSEAKSNLKLWEELC